MLSTTYLAFFSALLALPAIQPAPAVRSHSPFLASTTNICSQTALKARQAAEFQARSDFYLEIGTCLNESDPLDRASCISDAFANRADAVALAAEQYDERIDLCNDLGEDAYDPDIEPAYFVAGVDNPYFPLVPNTVRTYHKQTAQGLVVEVFTVTNQTRVVDGVTCIVVHDVVSQGGQVQEDTLDFFAQDVQGNVWYFGEVSQEFEDGLLVSLEGSWLTDRDGAKAGIVMEATPHVGDVYRQEFSLANAEDAAEIISLNAVADVPYGHFTHCLRTGEFTPIEPGVEEQKYYAAGVGTVLEVNLDTGERLELVSFTH